MINLTSYPTVFLLTAITVGLVKLRLSKDEDFQSGFRVPWVVLGLYLAGNIVSHFISPLYIVQY